VAALGYEVLWTRVLVLVVGSSSTAFALMLGLYLLGLAFGGFLMSRRTNWERRAGRTFWALQLSVAAMALLGAAAFGWLPSMALFGFAQLGTAPWSILAVNLLLIAAIILPPTLFIGASFPVAARLMAAARPHHGREVGIALAVTTAGNTIGILLTAFMVIPEFGLQQGIAVMAGLNALAAVVLWLVARDGASKLRYATPAAALALGIIGAVLPPWDITVMSSGVFRQAPVYLALLGNAGRLERAFSAYKTRYYREGPEAVVAVFDRPTLQGAPHRVLTIDGKVDASTGADMATQVLSGHLPFLFRPRARNALVIGLASGVTVGALARHGLDRIDVIEIEPAVVAASRMFDDLSGRPLRDARVNVTIGDGRRYLRMVAARYDMIVSEPSNPWLSMSARLFTREFFELVRSRLAPGGVLAQWIPLYGLSPPQFRALLRTLLDVFPNVSLFRVAKGDLVAIAGANPLSVDPGTVDDLFKGPSREGLARIGVSSPAQLLALWVADGQGMQSVIGRGEINTDDNGLLEFGSPWYLLSETIPNNLSVVARASAFSDFVPRLVEAWSTRTDGDGLFRALARRYLGTGRITLVRGLSAALRSGGRKSVADLLLGDAAAAEGRWSEADGIWSRQSAAIFELRRARIAFRTGQVAKAIDLFRRVPQRERSDEDNLINALALAARGRSREALELLRGIKNETSDASGVIIPFVRFTLYAGLEKPAPAELERKLFRARLDDLRRCLEVDGCANVVDRLLAWSRVGPPGMPPQYWERFRQTLYVRVTRPLPVFMRGVTTLWLGENAQARSSLRTYLNLLPEPDPLSGAHGLLDSMRPGPDPT
jgi:predicted membrane-bound spermidine synthase